MAEYADLELGIHRRDAGSYAIEFRFSQPKSEADIRITQDQAAYATVDLDELNQLVYNPDEYGRVLTASFFLSSALQTAFAQARSSAQSLNAAIRLRLLIGPSAPELHSVHWEMLNDPQDGSPLSTNENLLFSRYMSSLDWRPVRLRSRGDLRALVVVANPSNLVDYNLAAVDVQGEMERAKQGLGQILVTPLPESGSDQRVTVNNLFDQLRTGEHDILYLVCHGALIKEEAWLWLEDEQGKVVRLSGSELVTRLKELEQLPRLIVLASCESAGDGSGNALAALGPRLAEASIPAVIAMQGKVSMQTMAKFIPVFFRELESDGQIDRALAVARGAVRHQADYWMPALFMRLKSGRIWYVPGFGDEQDNFEKWQSLASFIQEKTCTPILGPALIESVLGSRSDIAIRWAEKHGFPLEPHDRDALPQVTQYIITQQSPAYLPVAYRGALREGILRRYQGGMSADLLESASWSTSQLQQALKLVGEIYASTRPNDPFKILAQLRLPIYITTWTVDFMTQALIEAGAEPVVRICPWTKWIPKEKALYEDEPTPEKPLVYHLFGHMSVPNSLVFSEDKYFDYLIGVTQNKSLIPSAVRAALNNTSLIFLGFQMQDWEFRVFFRFLMAQEGREMLKFFS
ncbi:MAG TPA: CHAT domain-containing protein, partial [Anaerolineales bacterium]|nr:CHAT domain-containing protein [Anaerolineales bacterium]